MRMRRALCALAAVLLGILPPAGDGLHALPPETDDWIRIETAHFTMYSNASERRTADLGRRLERFRAVLSLFYKKFKIDPPAPTSIYVFKHDASFTPYKKRYNDRPVESAGVFIGWPDGSYIVMNGDPGTDPLDIIYHEYVHQFLSLNMHGIPPWFNEGLAECFSTFQADDKSASIGRTAADHVLFLRENNLIPLRELFAITHDSPDYNEGTRRGIFYAQSWALVHYFMWDKPERRSQLGLFLDRLARGEEPDRAFTDSFATTYEKLERELRAHVGGTRFLFNAVKFSDLQLDTSTRVMPMKREEALARLGDLLVHVQPDRPSEAETHYREALQLNPAYASALGGLAILSENAERYDAAVSLFEKALAIEPDEPMTCFHFGRCLARRSALRGMEGGRDAIPPDVARARDLLAKSIRLRPGFAEPYVEFGRTYFASGGDLAPAIRHLETARQMLPARVDVLANLAMLHARNGDLARARDLVENGLARMNDREALESARRALKAEEAWRARTSLPAAAEPSSGAGTADVDDTVETPQGLEPLDTVMPKGAPVSVYNLWVEKYNKAVERANLRDYKGAIDILEGLSREVTEPDLLGKVKTFLQTLKRDAARRPRG
jgi:tetratricopeptide (TPR) repeat protein